MDDSRVLPVLYFHGFASSPASAKIVALRPLLAPARVELHTPDLNVPSFARLDFDAMVERALEYGSRVAPRVMVGSSLGALVALAAARRGLRIPLVLVAPALGVASRWKSRIPEGDPVTVFNFALNADAPIHRAFFEQVARLDVDQTPPESRVIVVMGRRDETVPYAIVEETWQRWTSSGALAPGSSFIELADGDHGLVEHTASIRDAILEAARG